MPFTRPVVGTDISAADFGQPTYDAIVAHNTFVTNNTPTAWTNVTFQNSFTNGAIPTMYRKVGDMVQIRGRLGGGPNGTTAFTLPAGFRPAVAFISLMMGPSATVPAMVSISTDGQAAFQCANMSEINLGTLTFSTTL